MFNEILFVILILLPNKLIFMIFLIIYFEKTPLYLATMLHDDIIAEYLLSQPEIDINCGIILLI